MFKELRRDWPITNLRPSDLDCYANWLQSRTKGVLRLPSYSEWEWFARSGVEKPKFSWGNEEDSSREALSRVDVRETLFQPRVNHPTDVVVSLSLLGTRVGLFEPSEWGIYDLMGAAPELTSDVIVPANIEQYRRALGQPINYRPGRLRIAKGVLLASRSEYWREGISKITLVGERDNRFSGPVGIRFVLEGN
ncbi:MAG: SUMF1/EgtB/PvdO family nonheme iron enzyme [Paracoccaceae bacterium]